MSHRRLTLAAAFAAIALGLAIAALSALPPARAQDDPTPTLSPPVTPVMGAFDPAEIFHGDQSKDDPPIGVAMLPLAVVFGVNLLMSLFVLPRLDASWLALSVRATIERLHAESPLDAIDAHFGGNSAGFAGDRRFLVGDHAAGQPQDVAPQDIQKPPTGAKTAPLKLHSFRS